MVITELPKANLGWIGYLSDKDGGLGSAVSEVCMDFGVMPKKFLRIGLENMYSSIVGSQQYLRSRYHMDSVAIIDRVKEILKTWKGYLTF